MIGKLNTKGIVDIYVKRCIKKLECGESSVKCVSGVILTKL
jgi:hypothetical protein